MSDKPLFLNSRSQRIRAELDTELLPSYDRLAHYSDVYQTRFSYTLPDDADLPPDYIEKSIYWHGGLGLVDYDGEKKLIAGSTVLRDPWGKALTWLPHVAGWAGNDLGRPTELLQNHNAAENPFFDFRVPEYAKIEDFCVLQSRQYQTLNQSLIAMSQPVLIEGVAGGEINAVDRANDVAKGKAEILQFEGRGNGARVLDLQGKDYTQNLISTVNALDCEVLSVFGINSTGTQKTSGITTEESVAIRQELALILRRDLDLRENMCKLFSNNGYKMSVRIAEPLKPYLNDLSIPDFARGINAFNPDEQQPSIDYSQGNSE